MTLDDLKGRWAKLAKREKAIMVAAGALVVLAIGNFAIWDPMAKSIASARGQLAVKKTQLAKVAAERAALSAEVDARSPAAKLEGKGARQIADAAEKGTVWQAPQAEAWMRQMVAGFGAGLSLAAVGAAGDADASLKGFYQHGLELQASGSWSQVDAFLKSQSASAALTITKMTIAPKDGGMLDVAATMKALSPEEHWQERREGDSLAAAAAPAPAEKKVLPPKPATPEARPKEKE